MKFKNSNGINATLDRVEEKNWWIGSITRI